MHPAIYSSARLLWPGGLETRQHLQELQRTQWWSAEQLQELQLRKLQRLVQHAYDHVPFYRERYQKAGICPQDISSLEDFQRLPFLTREDVRNHREALVADNARRDRLYPTETGGSTGEPIRFYIEGSFWWWNAANVFRMRSWYGVNPGDKLAWFWGAPKDMPEWSLKNRLRAILLQERYLNAFSMTPPKMKDYADMLSRWRPAMFKAYPSALALFARFMKEQNIGGIHPRLIETTSEKLTVPQRELLQEVFHCAIADQYSSREMGTMAYPCERGCIHISAELKHVEVVSDGKPAEPGQLGEIVATSLHQFAMPFIRYKKQDLGIAEAGNCACGRHLPRLREVVGRTNEFLVAANGTFVHSLFFSHIFRVRPEVVRYQVHQSSRRQLDVSIMCDAPVGDAWIAKARSEIQARFGDPTQISIRVVDDIPLTRAGKYRQIISDVQPDFVSLG